MVHCIIIILWLYLAVFSAVVPRPVVKQHHLIQQMMLFNLSSAWPSRVITCSAPACHRHNVINNNYKSTNMINTYWNGSTQAGNDFFPNSQRFPDMLAGWEMLIHHRRLSWYLLIKVSASLTGTPVLEIDVLYDVSHFLLAGIDCILSGGFWLRWIWVACNSEAVSIGWCCPWGLTGAQPPLSLILRCVRNYKNLKCPQQKWKLCVKPLRHRSPLQSANTVTEVRRVFKVTMFWLEWKAVWTESCSRGRAQGQ